MKGQAAPAMAGASMMMMPIMSGTGSVTVAITQQGRPIVAVAALLALIGSIAIGVMMMISQRSGTKRQVREGRERYLDYIEALRHTARDQIASQRAEQAWRHPRPTSSSTSAATTPGGGSAAQSHVDFLSVRARHRRGAAGLGPDARRRHRAAQRVRPRVPAGRAGAAQRYSSCVPSRSRSACATSARPASSAGRRIAGRWRPTWSCSSRRSTAPTTSRSRSYARTTPPPRGTGSSGCRTRSRPTRLTATSRHAASRRTYPR